MAKRMLGFDEAVEAVKAGVLTLGESFSAITGKTSARIDVRTSRVFT
jgi:hypothetical protein